MSRNLNDIVGKIASQYENRTIRSSRQPQHEGSRKEDRSINDPLLGYDMAPVNNPTPPSNTPPQWGRTKSKSQAPPTKNSEELLVDQLLDKFYPYRK